MPELQTDAPPLTTRQLQYVTFIREFTRLHSKAPAEMEIAHYFKVSPPSVHTMLVKLERLGAIAREPRTARSVRVIIPPTGSPHLDRLPASGADQVGAGEPAIEVARAVVNEMFVEVQERFVGDEDLIPMLDAVARAAANVLRAGGKTRAEAARARRAVLEYAAQSYSRLCAINDPEGADEAEDTGRFWDYLGGDHA